MKRQTLYKTLVERNRADRLRNLQTIEDMGQEKALNEYNRIEKEINTKFERENIEHTLELIARELAYEYWGLDFDLPVIINGRLKASGGRCHSHVYRAGTADQEIVPYKIEISLNTIITSYMVSGELDYAIEVLKHELTHYALWVQGIDHEETSLNFLEEINRVGAVYQGVTFSKLKAHECDEGCSFYRARKVPKSHICKKHELPIHYVGEILN